jgi:hypothetical protein
LFQLFFFEYGVGLSSAVLVLAVAGQGIVRGAFLPVLFLFSPVYYLGRLCGRYTFFI